MSLFQIVLMMKILLQEMCWVIITIAAWCPKAITMR